MTGSVAWEGSDDIPVVRMCSGWCLDRGRNLVRMWRDGIFQFCGYITFYCIYEAGKEKIVAV